MTSLLAKYLIVYCIIVYTSVTSTSSERPTTESILSTSDYSTVPIECDIFEHCCLHINTTSCLGQNCTRINCTTTTVSTTHFNLTSSPSLSTAESSFVNYTTVSISPINSTETVSNMTTQGNIPAKKDSRTSLKIFLIFVAIVVVIAVIVIIIGRRHCCNAVKSK